MRVKRKGPRPSQRKWYEEERAILRGEPMPEGGNSFIWDELKYRKAARRAAWGAIGEEVTAEWRREHPDSYPPGWHEFAGPEAA